MDCTSIFELDSDESFVANKKCLFFPEINQF